MKNKKSLLPIVALLGLLTSCNFNALNGNNNQEIINYDDFDNHDKDQIEDIVDDTDKDDDPTDLDEIEEKENDNEVPAPEGYDSFTNGKLDKNGGKYYLKGEYSKISITASKGSELYVYLDGATIVSTDGIAFGSEKQVTLHLVILNGTENNIKNEYPDGSESTEANAFHVKGNVYISGNGTLNVSSNSKGAIKVSKSLYIVGEVIVNASALTHAVAAESISISKATLNLSSQTKDGLNAECDTEKTTSYTSESGFIVLEDAKVTIDTYGDGMQASTFIHISGGTTDITTHGEFIAYSSSLVTSGEFSKDDFKYQKSGSTYIRKAADEIRTLNSSYYALVNSVKGLKVGPIEYEDGETTKEVTTGDYNIEINHLADVKINSTDDSIHCNYGDVTLNSCNIDVSSLDDGVHADYDLNINNCSIVIEASYEGLEGGNVTIDGEKTNIVTISNDDGINAASDYGTTHNVVINNGFLRIYAGGDGLDANTTLDINGGTIIVEGPGSNNGSLDAETIHIKGGLVFACSVNGMLERGLTATQNTFVYQGYSSMASGSLITIADSSNNALFSYTLKQACTQIIFSSADLVLQKTYKILNGTSTVASITQSSTLTKSGNTGGGGGPGGGGPGGGGHGW